MNVYAIKLCGALTLLGMMGCKAEPVAPPSLAPAPDLIIMAAPELISYERDAKFSLRCGLSNRCKFECSLDGGARARCQDEVTFEQLTLGPHTLEVRAINEHGRISPPQTWRWTIKPAP